MATSVILTNVTKEAGGRVLVDFSDGAQHEFQNLAALQDWAKQPDRSIELTRQLCISWAIARSADLSNIATIKNKTFTFDLSAAAPIKVQ